MKRKFLFIPLIISLLSGCDSFGITKSKKLEFNEGINLNQSIKKGELGEFNLVAPANDAIIDSEPTFTWTESQNAISYTLEVCSIDTFEGTSSSVVYAKETNISSTSYKLTTTLKTKNITYYWRVTAVNEYNSKSVGKSKISSVGQFFYQSKNLDEIEINVGEAGDWTLHKEGSYATISIDHSDFFGTGNDDSLTISFEEEDTKQGIPSSDGWIVVTKPLEMDFYGTDSLYFNFYYSGNDSNILIRLIDADGEYWYNQVKISQNSKQTILMKFSEFTLRTRDTIVQNEVFNYEHIQYIELCFEQTFGDGCCVVGGFKAVNFSNYGHLFVEKVNFNAIPVSDWIYESYDFGKTISQDGSELTLEYSTTAGFNGNQRGIGNYGYGFAKIPLERYFVTSNALRLKVKYTGYSSNVKCLIRIYEQDTDRWSYEQPFKSLLDKEYVELTIPFVAFAKSEMRGDGNRQFSYILQLQLGVSNVYGSGTISFKDIEVVNIPPVSQNKKEVLNDGIIEDFDGYSYRTQVYERWEMSKDNKDEGIFLSSNDMYHNGVNVNAGQFNYKSDMGLAYYDIYTDVKVEGLNGIKFWLKDGSKLSSEERYNYLKAEDVSPTFIIQIALKDGRWYRYTIQQAPRRWTEYNIKFSDFTLNQGVELDTSDSLTSENVVNFAFGMQYFYYLENGKASPAYTESNPVFMDNIAFTNVEQTNSEALEVEIHPDANNTTLVDNFEYASQESLDNHWFGLNNLDYEKVTLSDDVSSEGGEHSMKLDYRGAISPSYAHFPAVGSDVESRSLIVDIKGDGVATIYINLYVATSGSTYIQYRHTIINAASGWHRYVIGFGSTNFTPIDNPTASAIKATTMQSLQRLTFGVVNSGSQNLSSIYIDNLKFDYTNSYSSHSITSIN